MKTQDGNDEQEIATNELVRHLQKEDKKLYQSRIGALRAMRNYIDEHYAKQHPKSYALDNLQVLKRNVKRWLVQIDSEFENDGNPYGKFETKDIPDPGFFSKEQAETKKLLLFFERFFEAINLDIERLKKQKPDNTKTAIRAPAIALFCKMVGEAGIMKKPTYETIENHCRAVCLAYELPYTDRVRQCYSQRPTRHTINSLKERVIPLLDKKTSQTITDYLRLST